ncbi:TPA: hypothetical protein ACH525_005208, partial [Escherichia coli]
MALTFASDACLTASSFEADADDADDAAELADDAAAVSEAPARVATSVNQAYQRGAGGWQRDFTVERQRPGLAVHRQHAP